MDKFTAKSVKKSKFCQSLRANRIKVYRNTGKAVKNLSIAQTFGFGTRFSWNISRIRKSNLLMKSGQLQLSQRGYNVVASQDTANLIFKSTFFGYEPKLLTGDSSSGYHQRLKLTQISTGKTLEVNGFSRSLFGASQAATQEAWEKFPVCRNLNQ